MRVLVAEGQAAIRAGIRALLTTLPKVTVVAEAADAEAVHKLMREQRPHLVVIDSRMAGLNGNSETLSLRRKYPDLLIVIFSVNADADSARHAIASGANGYLVKVDLLMELEHAVRAVQTGGRYISSSVRMKGSVIHEFPAAELTPRQRQILTLIAGGRTNRQIAEELGVHIKTVESHRTDLMRRLGIHNVAGLVRYAIRQGLVALNDH